MIEPDHTAEDTTYCHRSHGYDCYCESELHQQYLYAYDTLVDHASRMNDHMLYRLAELAKDCLTSTDEHMRAAGQGALLRLMTDFMQLHQRGL